MVVCDPSSRLLAIFSSIILSTKRHKTCVHGKSSCRITWRFRSTGDSILLPWTGCIRWWSTNNGLLQHSPETDGSHRLLSANNTGYSVFAVVVLRCSRTRPAGPRRVVLLWGNSDRRAGIRFLFPIKLITEGYWVVGWLIPCTISSIRLVSTRDQPTESETRPSHAAMVCPLAMV